MALKEGALKFVVFLGTVRDGNFGQRAAKFIVGKLEARGHQTTLLGTDLCVHTRVSVTSLHSTVLYSKYFYLLSLTTPLPLCLVRIYIHAWA